VEAKAAWGTGWRMPGGNWADGLAGASGGLPFSTSATCVESGGAGPGFNRALHKGGVRRRDMRRGLVGPGGLRRRGGGLHFQRVAEGARPLGLLGEAVYALMYAGEDRPGHRTLNPRNRGARWLVRQGTWMP